MLAKKYRNHSQSMATVFGMNASVNGSVIPQVKSAAINL